MTLKKYQKKKKIDISFYDWISIKREKNYRIVYNDKIIDVIKKKLCKNISSIKKEKIRQYKLDKPKANKKTRLLGKIKISYKEYNKVRDSQIKEINDAYEQIIQHIKGLSPLEFINNFLKKNFFNSQKYFINTNISKKIKINEIVLQRYMSELLNNKKGNMTLEEEVDITIDKIFKKAKLNEVQKYLTDNINIEPFPKEKYQLKNNELDDEGSESTKYTIIDKCDSLKELDENIKKYREQNKNAKEKNKKIKIEVSDGESHKDDEEAEAYDEESLKDSSISSFSEKEGIEENEKMNFDN